MIPWEQVDDMNAEDLANQFVYVNPSLWAEVIQLLLKIDSEKAEMALGIASMDDRVEREGVVLRALNTSRIPHPFLIRAKHERRRHPRELARRLISGELKPGFNVG